ncbi:MAG: hypothetical protein ACPG5P_04450, partial [Saprospiraceae bacterium]
MSKLFVNLPGMDERSAKFLAKALSGNNLAGFDYLEFKESITNLAAMNLVPSVGAVSIGCQSSSRNRSFSAARVVRA